MARGEPVSIEATRRRLEQRQFAASPPRPQASIRPVPSGLQRRSLTAAGLTEAELSKLNLDPRRAPSSDEEILRYYQGAAGGETRFYVDRVGNLASRVALRPLRREGRRWVPDNDEAMVELVSTLGGRYQAQNELFGRLCSLFSLTGHCWLVGIPSGDRVDFEIVSGQELLRGTTPGSPRKLQRQSHSSAVDLPANATTAWLVKGGLIRSMDPDTPVRSALPILRMLERLHLAMAAISESRLTGAGLLLVASEIDRAAPDDGEEVFSFADELAEVMTSTLADQGTAAARVPITVEIASEYIQNGFKFLDLSKQSDENLLRYMEHELVRLARAYDLPDEVLTPGGMADVNHWSAWYIGEREYSNHLAPLLNHACSALTRAWLHPILVDNGIDPEDHALGFDPADILAEPDQVDKVRHLYPLGLVSREKAAEMVGLDPETDLPDVEEDNEDDTRRKTLVELASKSDKLAAIILPLLGVDLSELEKASLLGISPALPEAPPDDGTGPIDVSALEVPARGPADGTPAVGPAIGLPAPPESKPPGTPANRDVNRPGPAGGGDAPTPKRDQNVTASAGMSLVQGQALAVQTAIDAAVAHGWRVAGQRLARKAGKRAMLEDADPCDVGRLLGRGAAEGLCAAGDLFDGPHVEVASRQLLELIPDPAVYVRAHALLRSTLVDGFFGPRNAGPHAVALPTVIDLLEG